MGFSGWLIGIIAWLNARNRDGTWEVRVYYCRGNVEGKRTSRHRVTLPDVLGDGFEVSLGGTVRGVLPIEPSVVGQIGGV